MFRQLKVRLVLLYGITSSVILTVIIIGAFFINYQQRLEQNRVVFQKNVEQIAEKIRSDHVISSTYLANMQSENHILVFIEENQKQLLNYCWPDKDVDTAKLLKRLKELSAKDGLDLYKKPLYKTAKKTSVYSIQQNGLFRDYLGMAVVLPTDMGWQNIIAIYIDNDTEHAILKEIFLFTLIDLIGVAALFLVSSFYIGKVIKPLEEGHKKQNSFVAAASHELRSPLTVIKAGITSMKEDMSKAEQFLPHIEGECDRMTRLISDMLLLASADAQTWSMTKEQVDMDTLLIESYDMFCTCFNKYQNQLTLELPEEALHSISGDRERIKQILTILMDNAISYAPFGSAISMRAFNQKNNVIVEVEDHGKGINEEDKEHIFDRFYQGNKSRNEKKHFGLGLSIAKELAELHEGTLFAQDTPGGGATFVLKLPC